MATETLYADALVSGAVSSSANALGASNSTYTSDTGNVSWTARFSMGNPTGNTANGTHTITLRVRKDSTNTGTPTITSVALYAGAASLGNIGAGNWGVTSTPVAGGQDIAITFNSSLLASYDLSTIAVHIVTAGAGGSATVRGCVQLDAVTWSGDFTTVTAKTGTASGGYALDLDAAGVVGDAPARATSDWSAQASATTQSSLRSGTVTGDYSFPGTPVGDAPGVERTVSGWSQSAEATTLSAGASYVVAGYGFDGSATGLKRTNALVTGGYAYTAQAFGPITHYFATAVSTNGRYLVDQLGNPWMMRGDSPWAMAVLYSTTDMEFYLTTRADQGFNAVLVSALGNTFNGGPYDDGRTYDGVYPFIPADSSDPSQLNETYWTRIDALLDIALEQGITVMLYPLDGWVAMWGYNGLAKNWTNTQAYNYGQALGNRYKNYPNLIFSFGGDYDLINADVTDDERQGSCLDGLRSVGANQLCTVQGIAEQTSYSGSAYWDSRVDWSFVYTYSPSYAANQKGYAETPTIPAINAENDYEHEGGANIDPFPYYFRQQLSWAMTSGSPGAFYGRHGAWDGVLTANQLTTLSPGAYQYNRIFDFFAGLENWYDLVPDSAGTLVTTGRGTKYNPASNTYGPHNHYYKGDFYITAAKRADSKMAIIYVPYSYTGNDVPDVTRTFTVDTTQLTLTSPRARWVDPVSLQSQPATFSTTFTTPGLNSGGDTRWDYDWILVLDDSSDATGTVGASLDYTHAVVGLRTPVSYIGGGAHIYTGSVSGVSAPRGTVVGDYAFAGGASGAQPAIAAASVVGGYAFNLGFVNGGSRIFEGTAVGGYAYASVPSGYAPPMSIGTVAGSYVSTGAVVGQRKPQGTVIAVVTWSGSASTALQRNIRIVSVTQPESLWVTNPPYNQWTGVSLDNEWEAGAPESHLSTSLPEL